MRIEVGFIWKYLVRGTRTRTSRNSQSPHEHYKKARKLGFSSVVDRYEKCPAYRASILREGRNRGTCEEYDQQGDPTVRVADTKPYAERKKMFGRWMAYENVEAVPEHGEQRWGQEWSSGWQWSSSSGQHREGWQR